MSNINDDVEISISQLGLAPRQLSREGFTFTCPSLSEHLEEIVKEKKFTDVKIVVGEDEFDCHLLVLRSYSEYIDQIAKNDWIDSQIIQLPDSHVSSTAFEMIYDWILAESTRIVERINFVEIFKAAKFLKIGALVSQCMCIIDDQELIGEREALSLYLEAIEADEPFLKNQMMKKIEFIFLTFVASIEFLELSFANIQDLFKLNSIAVNSEIDVLFSAILWLKHDWQSRHQHLIPLMSLVRFELMQSWQLVELKKCPAELIDILGQDDMKEIIDEALALVALDKSNHDFGDTIRIPKVLKRKKISHDSLWKSFNFEENHDFYVNYQNFCKYLRKINGNHWEKIALRETRENGSSVE